MSDKDLFEEKDVNKDKDQEPDKQVKDQDKQPTNFDPLLGMIVNSEGQQKYNSVEEALKGANHANTHIAKLEQELKSLRDAKDSAPNLDDVISAIQSQNNQDPDKSDNSEVKPFTATDIQSLVEQTLNNISTKTTQDQNVADVTGKFKELFGEKASETLYGKANDLGMSREDINSLIAKNPTAALRVLGIDEKAKPTLNTDNGTINTEGFQQKAPDEIPSSMGYLSSKQLESNWLASKERTLKKLSS